MKFTGKDIYPFSFHGEAVFIPCHVSSLAIICCRDEIAGYESKEDGEKGKETHCWVLCRHPFWNMTCYNGGVVRSSL